MPNNFGIFLREISQINPFPKVLTIKCFCMHFLKLKFLREKRVLINKISLRLLNYYDLLLLLE